MSLFLGNTSEDRATEDRVLKTMREFPAQGRGRTITVLLWPGVRYFAQLSVTDSFGSATVDLHI
jgi:hypothetical protein